MKIVYMGTPDFAVPPLAALVKNGYEVSRCGNTARQTKRKRKDTSADSCQGRSDET